MRTFLKFFVFVIINLSFISYAQFTQIGPYGGYIRAITNDNQGRILAATYLGGIFRSSDNGQTWEKIYDNSLLIADFRSVAVNSSGHIFAGTDGSGLLRSTDGGATWEKVSNTFSSSTITTLAVNADRLFIGSLYGLFYSDDEGSSINSVTGISGSIGPIAINSSGDLFAGTFNNGAFRSTDDGVNWTAINTGLDINGYGILAFAFNSSGDIITTNGSKVYLSTDNGDNWQDLNAPTSFSYQGVVVGSNDKIIAAQTDKIFRSTDGGGSWNQLTNWPGRIPSIQCLLSFNGIIYSGISGLGVYNSSDDGDNWNLGVDGMTNTHVNEIADGPNGELYAGTSYAGIFYSSDDGVTWENRTNNIPMLGSINSYWVTKVEVNPLTGTVLVVTQDGCFRSTDMGNTWAKLTIFTSVAFDFNSAGDVYAGYSDRFYKSTDDGVTWNQKFPSVSPISDISVDVSDKVYVASDGEGVTLSTDGGDNWNPINDGLDDLNIKLIVTRKNNGSVAKNAVINCSNIMCATNSKISSYENNQWNIFETFADIFTFDLLDRKPKDKYSGTIVAVIDALRNDADAFPEDCSTIVLLQNFEGEEIITIVDIPASGVRKVKDVKQTYNLLVGTKGGGIYAGGGDALPVELEDFFANVNEDKVELKWNTANEVNNYGFEIEREMNDNKTDPSSLINNHWTDISFVKGSGNSNSPKSYTFTDETLSNGNYSYRLKQIDNDGNFSYSKEIKVTVNEIPKEYSLMQNYPNPFNPTTEIGFRISNFGFVSLKVYDLLGREVATLVNEEKTTGTYEVIWNAANLPTSVYYYRIQAGSFNQVRKMLLIK